MEGCTIIVFGLGKIGNSIAHLLHEIGHYKVIGVDKDISIHQNKTTYRLEQLDLSQATAVQQLLAEEQPAAIVSCLPFFLNLQLAKIACELNIHYFDLTEDVATQQAIMQLDADASCAMVPQCGLAPGLIGKAGVHVASMFTTLNSLALRVGALPLEVTGRIKYARSWSTVGLVNEYIKDCECIQSRKRCMRAAMSGYETTNINGSDFEAFHTSGGVGSLINHYLDSVETLDYKTLRHIGHHDAMLLLLDDLNFRENPEELVKLLDQHIPLTTNDQVIIFVKAVGTNGQQNLERTAYMLFESTMIHDNQYTAIQLTTALSACAAVEEVLRGKLSGHTGYVGHHDFDWNSMINNCFGRVLRESSKTWQGV